MAVTGGCLCGAVRYEARGSSIWSTMCHCETCRRAAAAPAVAWVTFSREAFAFIEGTPRQYPSSTGVRRTFCADCGTPLTYVVDTRPAEIDVTTGSLDDPAAHPPTFHVWASDALPWARFEDGLPRIEKGGDGA